MNPISMGMTLGVIGAVMALPLLVIGVLLVRMGHWPKRQGSEPHCRKCDYLLKGIDSPRCPECGTIIDETTKVFGHRKRFAGLTLTGAAFIVLGLAALIPIGVAGFRRVYWYHYKPTFLVIREIDAAGMSSPQANRPWMELIRREKAGGLSDSTINHLVENALQFQANMKPQTETDFSGVRWHPAEKLFLSRSLIVRTMAEESIEFLGRQSVAGKMSEVQRNTFLEQSCAFTLGIDSHGKPETGFEITINPKMRISGFSGVEFWLKKLHIDGREWGRYLLENTPVTDALRWNYPSMPPTGDHVLDIVCHVTIYDGNGGQVIAKDFPFSSRFRVSPASNGGKIVTELHAIAPAQ